MNNTQNPRVKGKKYLIIGAALSPSIPFVAYRLSEGIGGLNAAGFGPMEFIIVPLYAAVVITSVVLIIKGVELIFRG